jgi:U32 family peptidase
MTTPDRKIELLAPAGNFEKLEIAIHYGADAVYLAGKDFSLRNFSGNFTPEELEKGIALAHKHGVKVYLACNIYSRNCEQKQISTYLNRINEIKPDAVIIADPGIIYEAQNISFKIPIHLSTQANTTNYRAVRFWEKIGVKRINPARELSLKEIRVIVENTSIQIETFVHGAMCISYSGRCLLSSFMTGRHSNQGRCAHPCRWKYTVQEQLRPGLYMPVAEDGRGTYIFNSKDLCMIEHIPEMIQAGIFSLKIEGRMKGIDYLASTVKVYRQAIDSFYSNPEKYKTKKDWIRQLALLNHRGYSTGFYFDDPEQIAANFTKADSKSIHGFIGKIIDNSGTNMVKVEVRNKVLKGETVEILTVKGDGNQDCIKNIIDLHGDFVELAQPGEIVIFELNHNYKPCDIIKKGVRY